MKSRLLTLAGALALMAVLGKYYAVPALAQARAALIKNIDEKGRNPYIQSGFLSCAAGTGLCDLFFPAVPSGKRLVIEQVSANINTSATPNATFLVVSGGTYFTLAPSGSAASTFFAVNARVLAFYESGQTPVYRVAMPSSSPGVAIGATVAGYLVDLTQ
jgi:hypothetical protein